LYRAGAVLYPDHDGGWTRGGIDRRGVHAAAALQRRVDWLSIGLDHRRRAGAVHLDLAVRNLQLDGADRHLCRDLRDYQHRRDIDAAGLHQQGDLDRGGIRGRLRRAIDGRRTRRAVVAQLERNECRPARWQAPAGILLEAMRYDLPDTSDPDDGGRQLSAAG